MSTIISLTELISNQRELIEKKSNTTSLLNILEFAESKRIGLGLKLYPMQKFILKVFYKIPLTDSLKDNAIEIRDKYNEKVLHTFTEVECFNFLYQEHRINFSYKEYKDIDVILEILFFLGRRASKTLLVSVIFLFGGYLLIKIKNPHRFFGVSRTEPISFIAVSNNEEGGVRQYNSLKSMLTTAPFFIPYLRGSDKVGYWLASPRFLKVLKYNPNITAKGDINFFGSAATGKVRGGAYIQVALDEYAHFPDSQVANKSKSRDLAVYEALVPSTAGFISDDGTPYGKSFVMTSPNGKKGDSYKKYGDSFTSKNLLMLNMPSHWVNNRMSPAHLRKMYMESESSARQEFGAEFVESVGNFIKDTRRLEACVNTSWVNSINNASKGGAYNLSSDLAQSGDGVAFFITHKEATRPEHTHICLVEDTANPVNYPLYLAQKNIVVVDYYIQLVPEEGGTIHHDVILAVFVKLYQYFNIIKTTIDQWSYQTYSELLDKQGVIPMDTLELFNATEVSNSLIAKTFSRLLGEGRLMFPDSSESDGTLDEIKALVETIKHKGLINVQAPIGGNDDRYSALSRSCYMSETSEESQTLISTHLEQQTHINPKTTNVALLSHQSKELKELNKQVKIKKFTFGES